ncbi:hypothetical protein M405DRAFT_816240 [Rhizopogon salebrosus TDB-379]|nr:hypothetical protein M405DRAFT_816240 [Rhizopogon salebrosus TDB-379]
MAGHQWSLARVTKPVQVIIDVQPFKLYWDEHTIDLSGKSLDGINYLKEFLPKLDSLTLSHNQTIHHLLLECHQLGRALGRKATSIPFLLSDSKAMPHLVRYINRIRRLKDTFGEIPLPPAHQN